MLMGGCGVGTGQGYVGGCFAHGAGDGAGNTVVIMLQHSCGRTDRQRSGSSDSNSSSSSGSDRGHGQGSIVKSKQFALLPRLLAPLLGLLSPVLRKVPPSDHGAEAVLDIDGSPAVQYANVVRPDGLPVPRSVLLHPLLDGLLLLVGEALPLFALVGMEDGNRRCYGGVRDYGDDGDGRRDGPHGVRYAGHRRWILRRPDGVGSCLRGMCILRRRRVLIRSEVIRNLGSILLILVVLLLIMPLMVTRVILSIRMAAVILMMLRGMSPGLLLLMLHNPAVVVHGCGNSLTVHMMMAAPGSLLLHLLLMMLLHLLFVLLHLLLHLVLLLLVMIGVLVRAAHIGAL